MAPHYLSARRPERHRIHRKASEAFYTVSDEYKAGVWGGGEGHALLPQGQRK